MFVVKPNVVRPASVPSPPSLHSLAFVASIGLPTSDLADRPPVKSKQIKSFKDAPGRYILVEQSRSSKRIVEYDENSYGRSEYTRSVDLLFDDFLLYHKGDSVVTVTRGRDWRVWNIGGHRGWNFTVNGETRQPHGNSRQDGWIVSHSSTLKAQIDKDGSLNSEFILSQQNQKMFPNTVQFDVQIKITFEDNKMKINVRGENEHFEGNFIGHYIKLGKESSPDSYGEESDEWESGTEESDGEDSK